MWWVDRITPLILFQLIGEIAFVDALEGIGHIIKEWLSQNESMFITLYLCTKYHAMIQNAIYICFETNNFFTKEDIC